MKVISPKSIASSRNEKILDYCRNKKVLHIGACDSPYTKEKYNGEIGPLLYREIDKVCSEQLGIDIDKENIQFLNGKQEDFPKSQTIFFDMNNLGTLDFEPDIIIFGEVIEHLMNLETALTNLKKIMTSDSLLIISTPNCHGLQHILTSLLGYEIMHEDHKVYFSYGYLKNLLSFNQLEVERFYFTELDDFKSKEKFNLVSSMRSLTVKGLQLIFKYNKGTLLFICKKAK